MLPRPITKKCRSSRFWILAGFSTAVCIQGSMGSVQAQSSTPFPPETLPSSADSDRTVAPAASTAAPVTAQPATTLSSPATSADLKSNSIDLQVPSDPKQVEVQKTIDVTLEQAIKTAQDNSPTVRVANLQLVRSQAALREIESSLYPTLGLQSSLSRDISASGDISTRISRRTTRDQINKGEATLQGLLATPIPTDPIDVLALQQQIETVQSKLAAGQTTLDGFKNYGSTTLNNTLALNYTIYSGGQRPALIQSAKEQVRLTELEVERVSEQLRLDVTNAYYDAQSANEQVRIETAAIEETTRSLRNAEVLAKNGLATKLDVLNAQVQLDDAAQRLASAQTQQQASRRQLSRILNVAATVTVSASDPVKVLDQWNLSLEESIIQALKKRVELQQQQVQRNISVTQKTVARSSLKPRVAAFANYNVLALGNDTPGDTASRGWGQGYSVGLSSNWSLYDGGAARARAVQAEQDIAIAETRFVNTSTQIRFDVEQSFFNLQSNLKNLQTATTSLDRAKEALRIARYRFESGVGTQNDVLDTESRLTRAESNLVQATLGYNRALAAIRRAVSNFAPARTR